MGSIDFACGVDEPSRLVRHVSRLLAYVCLMSEHLTAIPMLEQIPAGAFGPAPVTLDVRSYLVPHDSGLVLVDTGMDPTGQALDAALAAAGASWSDVTDVVLTHGHRDHTGALAHVRGAAPGAVVGASPLEGIADASPLTDGDPVRSLRAFATPGHTAGHLSLYDESHGVLLVGDCLGVTDGRLVRAPAQFTADAAQAELSLRRLLELRGARMLFSHGPEIDHPWAALDQLLTSS